MIGAIDAVLASAELAELSKNSPLGDIRKNPALHQGQAVCNSTTALGMRGSLALKGIRSRCTGKERDAETGLDYFGARYYSSTMGRFLSPDWAATATAVPYADFGDPQSLNLYGYVRNNPLNHADADGHCPACVEVLEQAGPVLEDYGAAAIDTLKVAAGATWGYVLTHLPESNSQPLVGGHFGIGADGGTTQVLMRQDSNGSQTHPDSSTSGSAESSSGTHAGKDNAPRSDLPRDEQGNYKPDPNAQGAHSTTGTRTGSDGKPYRQGATFDDKGNFVGRTDVTDHGRADHTNPHFHPATGPASVGKPQPIPEESQ